MRATLKSLRLGSYFLLLIAACAHPAPAQEKGDEPKDVITVRKGENLKTLARGSEIWIVVEFTHNKASQPMVATATFEKGDVLYGQFIGTPPQPTPDNPKVLTSNIKLLTPKYKGKYKFNVSCHYEGAKVYNVRSKSVEIEIE